MWIRCDNAFAPIIPLEQFTQAVAIIESRHTHLTNEELLERLRNLLARIGELSGILIDEAEDMPSSTVYMKLKTCRRARFTRAVLVVSLEHTPSLATHRCET
jgi:hypothetical protein